MKPRIYVVEVIRNQPQPVTTIIQKEDLTASEASLWVDALESLLNIQSTQRKAETHIRMRAE